MIIICGYRCMTNFKFLKKIDKDLYEIANEAENLYRDEYFEQCITQTRRFAENICKNVLGSRVQADYTFDDMLNKLKDISCSNPREKEFIDDLYFIKKAGNKSVHSGKVKQDGILAMECLQRAFEIGINYALTQKDADRKIAKLRYDEEMLVLGERVKRVSLKEKYLEQKGKEEEKEKNKAEKNKTKSIKKVAKIKNAKKVNISDKQKQVSYYPLIIGALIFGIFCFFMILDLIWVAK